MNLNKIIIASLIFSAASTSCFAENDAINRMVNTNNYIVDYDKAVSHAKKVSQVTVEFPTFIPKPKSAKKYYASFDENSRQYGFEYMINIDETPDCHGVKVCNIGIISARKSDEINMMKDRKNKLITKPVMLADGINAYFTPGHAMGDYFPADIQWKDGAAVYMISWNRDFESAKSARDFLSTMASSAKHPGSG